MIISSDLSRAKETGGSKVILPFSFVNKRIREMDWGQVDGTTEAERINNWRKNWREIDLEIEKDEEVSGREIDFLAEIVKNINKNVLLL